jgi:hypothetical protein
LINIPSKNNSSAKDDLKHVICIKIHDKTVKHVNCNKEHSVFKIRVGVVVREVGDTDNNDIDD